MVPMYVIGPNVCELPIVENARQSHTWQWASGHVRFRSNVCEGYRAVDETLKKSLASLFHCFLNVKSTSQILRIYLTGNEKRVREAQH